jgi:hypothetical protein
MNRTRLAVRLFCAVFFVWGACAIAAGVARAQSDAQPQSAVPDGAPIRPEFAETLYKRLAPLQEADGCHLVRFDTARFRIVIGLAPPAGGEVTFEIASAPDLRPVERRVGQWALAIPPDTERECGATVAAIQRVLQEVAAPRGGTSSQEGSRTGPGVLPSNHAILAGTFALVLLGTVYILYRELKTQRPPLAPVLLLAMVWVAALVLRLTLSPHAFMHEYYHIAETVPGYLSGEISGAYGKTGPALFRLMAALLRRPDDVGIIFLTTAIVSSLAIPAVALFDLAVMGSWPRALCAAVLLAVLPQHLRFSAAEDLFVQAITFGFWSLALFALYLRTRRLGDGLLAALATSLAMQSRPEMLFFPGVLLAFTLLVQPRPWRILLARPTLVAFAVLAVLLVPRLFELRQALQENPGRSAGLPDLRQYLHSLVVLQSHLTPPLYWLFGLLGLAFDGRRRPGYYLWVLLVFVGFTLFSLSLFDNPPYNLRSQTLPNAYLVLIAAGAASLWMAIWGARQGLARSLGVCLLAVVAATIVVRARGFVTELRDQQLEWRFLERTVALLPGEATLLAAVNIGGRNLDAFPEFLLRWNRKSYRTVDVRNAAQEGTWPQPDGGELLFYQGMFCYFAMDGDPLPEPMTPPCLAVHERYVTEPMLVTDLETQGYSALHYAPPPYRIGFFRLRPR